MSLDCSLYRIDPKTGDVGQSLRKSWAVGPESWRSRFYGSPIVKSLGLKLVPSLEDDNIYAQGSQLRQLEDEVRIMIDNMEDIAQATGGDAEGYLERLKYISTALDIAKASDYMVVIG